jgi:transcriptional regulator GlxA family with amidase domain
MVTVPEGSPMSGPVSIVLYEGVSGHEALGALAAFLASGRPAEFVSIDALVATVEGARIVPHRLGHAGLESAEVVVVPGGEVKRALADAALLRALRARRGHWLLVSGDALRLAAAADLTEGRRTAHATSARLVADGRLLSCTGGDALVDLVFHFVSRTEGVEAAARAASLLGRDYRPFAMGGTES